MAYVDVLYEVKSQVAWLTINRPDKGNSFGRQTVLELIHALNEARNDPEVRVVVLTGAATASSASGARKSPATACSTTTTCRRWWTSTC